MGTVVIILCVVSVVMSLVLGQTNELSSAAVLGATQAFELVLKLAGGLCFWSGIMRVAQKAGICDFLAKLLKPVLRLIFPKLPPQSSAAKLISMNISANLLGLGNAATPFGIAAMKELSKLNPNKSVARDDMVCFAVINSSSIQLLPTTLALLRASYGAQNPLDILPSVICASVLSLCTGLLVAKILPIYMRGKK